MIIVTATARLTEEGWTIAEPAMKDMIKATLEEDGCIDYVYARDLNDPAILRVTEKFADMEALEKHFAAPHMAVFRSALAKAGPQGMVIDIHEAEKVDFAF